MWSLCRCVRNNAWRAAALAPTAGGVHQNGAPAVEEKVAGGRPHQCGGTGPFGVGERDYRCPG